MCESYVFPLNLDLAVGLCVLFQVSPVGYFGNGPGGDQDGSLCEEQDFLGGQEMQDTEDEGGHFNLSRERRKYVVFIKIIAFSLTLCKVNVDDIK